MPRKTQKNKRGLLLLPTLLCCLLGPALGRPTAALAAEAPPAATVAATAQAPAKKSLDEILKVPFTYRRDNRPDPFKPFLSEKAGPTPAAQDEEAVLTGMQLFEPSQLTLVAILFSGQQAIAMVEDSTGMGHIVKAKDKIGRRGEIKAIEPNAVIIEQWALATDGSKKVTTSEMVLRKEGDK